MDRPRQGCQFLQTDPIGSKDDLDLYAYTADDPIDKTDPTGDDALEVGIQWEFGPWSWSSGSYRVGNKLGSIFNDPHSNSLGKFKTNGTGFGLAFGANVNVTYCKNCNSVSDVAGTSQTAQGNLVVGLGYNKQTKDQMDYMGGSFKQAVDGKDSVTVSFGPDVGLVPIGESTTKVTPTVDNGVSVPQAPPKQSWWTKPNPVIKQFEDENKKRASCVAQGGKSC